MEGGRRDEAEGALTLAGARYYVFDMDGTLISLPVEWDEVRADLKRLTGTELDFSPFFLDFERIVAKDPMLRDPMMRVIDGYEAEAVPAANLEPGTMEVLSALSRRAQLSLVTMQGRATRDKVFELLGIGRFFRWSFTREDSTDRPTQLSKALEAMGATPEETVFVGDRINDLKAARAVRARFVMIRKRPDAPAADALYRSMSEFARSPWVLDSGA